MNELQRFDPQGKCPKCGYDDLSTQYVKRGDRYGMPCWNSPQKESRDEHLHRYCRRCGYEWCVACMPADTETPAHETDHYDIAVVEKEMADLRRIAGILANSDFIYHFKKYAAGYNALLTRYARFKVGDRVQLKRTPTITEHNAPGWMTSKHFLVQGARGTVASSDLYPDSGTLYYGITFDDESWLDVSGKVFLIEAHRRHTYTFSEDALELEDG